MHLKFVREARAGIAFLALTGNPIGASAVDIALTNDDGWAAQGIQALYEALSSDGHRVSLVAPALDQSGSSAAINGGDLRVRRERDDQFSVSACRQKDCTSLDSGKPATSAFLAIDIATRRAGRPPALLLSGINAGANLGPITPYSGTVGAAIAATTGTHGSPIPSLAVSTDPPAACKGEPTCVRAHYAEVATFIVKLINELVRRSGSDGSLLPPGTALNINYPPVAPRGVRMSEQGRTMLLAGKPVRLSIGCARCLDAAIGETVSTTSTLASGTKSPSREENSDVVLYSEGFITVVPITADHTARNVHDLRWIGRAGLLDDSGTKGRRD